jgi:hypothetical protein
MTMARKRKPKSITIIGRRWFDSRYGNTYHSVTIYVDGICVQRIPFSYGYDRMYLQTATEWLDANGYLVGREKRDGTPGEPLWRYCERKKIALVNEVSDVSRRKDL